MQDRPLLRMTFERGRAARLAEVGAARCGGADVYQRTLQPVALDLYQSAVLTLGQAAKLCGLDLGDFIDLCGRLNVPVLWAPEGGIGAEVDAFESALQDPSEGESEA